RLLHRSRFGLQLEYNGERGLRPLHQFAGDVDGARKKSENEHEDQYVPPPPNETRQNQVAARFAQVARRPDQRSHQPDEGVADRGLMTARTQEAKTSTRGDSIATG